MRILNLARGLFAGVGRKRLMPGTRVIVSLDGRDVLGVVLSIKMRSRRKRVLVRLNNGKRVAARRCDVTVD